MARAITSHAHDESALRRSRRHFEPALRACLYGLLLLAALGSAACEITGSDACDEHQIYETGGTVLAYGVCVCDEKAGYVFDILHGYGCKRCADNQRVVDGKCVASTPDAGAAKTDAGDEDAGTSPSAPSSATGVGEPCKSNADCLSFDAKYCAPVVNVCRINNCASGQTKCPSGAVCCDYNRLLTGLSLCISNDELDNGQCTMGGVKVEP